MKTGNKEERRKQKKTGNNEGMMEGNKEALI